MVSSYWSLLGASYVAWKRIYKVHGQLLSLKGISTNYYSARIQKMMTTWNSSIPIPRSSNPIEEGPRYTPSLLNPISSRWEYKIPITQLHNNTIIQRGSKLGGPTMYHSGLGVQWSIWYHQDWPRKQDDLWVRQLPKNQRQICGANKKLPLL